MSKSRTAIHREELVELVRTNPELYDPKHCLANDSDHIKAVWTEIAEKLNATQKDVQRTWEKIKDTHGKRRSLRSSTANELGFLTLPLIEFSNENSCASSNCSSPKGEGKRSTRSVSQISTASEAENSRSSKSISGSISRERNKSRRGKGEAPPQEQTRESSEQRITECDSSAYQSRQTSVEKSTRSSLSEQSPVISKQHLQNAVGSTQRRVSTPNLKNKMKHYNICDPTRTFFESMAMTVAMFPQHIQAELKMQICKIVGDMEFQLSMPSAC